MAAAWTVINIMNRTRNKTLTPFIPSKNNTHKDAAGVKLTVLETLPVMLPGSPPPLAGSLSALLS